MCGRYYIGTDTEDALLRLVGAVPASRKAAGDVRPSEEAPVIAGAKGDLSAAVMRWGFLPYGNGGLLINARAETAQKKPTFSDSVSRRRCVIPASGFYEWDRRKRQYTFFLPDSPVLYMAGCYRRYGDGDHFTILTTAANESMSEIHDRMPLILPENAVTDWIFEDGKTAGFLKAGSPLLTRRETDPRKEGRYEQLTLPGVF